MSKIFWRWKNEVVTHNSELIIEGAISSESWYGDEATPAQLREELANRTGDLTVHIDSPGGDVFGGISMFNALKRYDGKVTIVVDALAASIASVIAMAGDEIVMSEGSMIYIHKPWTMIVGNSEDMREAAEMLEKLADNIVDIYVSRTGRTKDEILAMLAGDGTWLSAQDAIDNGFAEKAEGKELSLSEAINNTIRQMQPVKSAVMQPVMSLVKTIESSHREAKEEEVDNDTATTTPKAEDVEQTTEATTPTKAEAKAKAEVETPETEVKSDETVEAKETNSDEVKETKAMNETIAKAQVKQPAEAPQAKATVDLKAYLKTNEAMDVFAQILEANPSEMGNGGSAAVRDAWKKHLEVKAGVTNPEVFLPTPLVTAIQNAFEDGGEIWNRVAKVGADVWNAAWDAQNDVHSNNGRGRGYNRADEENKAEQLLTFDTRLLRPQFVYKYITLNKEDIKEQRSTGALVTYILSELPQRIVREVERAIVLGDGRAVNDDYKIKEGTPRGFYPLVKDALANNYFGATVDASAEILPKAVALAKDKIKTAGEVIVIAKKGFSTEARFATDNDGKLLYPLGTRATDVFDVTTVIEPDWFDDVSSPTVDAIVVVLEAYKVVGDTTIEGFQNFILKTNKQEYLQEIWAGGGLTGHKAAIALTNGASS